MNISVSNNILSVIPPENYFGQTNIIVAVSDGEYIDSTDFTLTVNAVNDAPVVLQPLDDIILMEDLEVATRVLSEHFYDIDSDTLILSLIHI